MAWIASRGVSESDCGPGDDWFHYYGGDFVSDAILDRVRSQLRYFPAWNLRLSSTALGSFELEIIKRLPYSESMRKWIAKRSKSLRELRGGLVRTPEALFTERVSRLKTLFPESRWLGLLVNRNPEPMNFPRAAPLADKYNGLLKGIYHDRFIGIGGVASTCFMPDGFHLNADGHRYVWERIKSQMKGADRQT